MIFLDLGVHLEFRAIDAIEGLFKIHKHYVQVDIILVTLLRYLPTNSWSVVTLESRNSHWHSPILLLTTFFIVWFRMVLRLYIQYQGVLYLDSLPSQPCLFYVSGILFPYSNYRIFSCVPMSLIISISVSSNEVPPYFFVPQQCHLLLAVDYFSAFLSPPAPHSNSRYN